MVVMSRIYSPRNWGLWANGSVIQSEHTQCRNSGKSREHCEGGSREHCKGVEFPGRTVESPFRG